MTKVTKTMPVEFETFKEECRKRGYVNGVVDQSKFKTPQLIFAMRTKNGVKTEIKPTCYTVGYGRTVEEIESLKEEMVKRGYNIVKMHGKCFNVGFDGDVLERFWDIVALVEDIDSITGKSRSLSRKICTKEEAKERIYEKIAMLYRTAIDNNIQHILDNHRNILAADWMDDVITIGESKNRTEDDTYREHIVPCIMIHNEAIDMTMSGKSITEVAEMIRENLAIVNITNTEAKLLDVTMGLQTTMPEGWKFGDSKLARLEAANIELK